MFYYGKLQVRSFLGAKWKQTEIYKGKTPHHNMIPITVCVIFKMPSLFSL